jgi:hypothetical protein
VERKVINSGVAAGIGLLAFMASNFYALSKLDKGAGKRQAWNAFLVAILIFSAAVIMASV